ncbi:MAG: hypothetical protein KDA60_15740 [Planctomycetales bacterium]|nr:hypothetical protein [Planctomycetales bacterium]
MVTRNLTSRFGNSRRSSDQRRGTAFIISVMVIVVFVAFIALVVDIGYLANARTELQRTADATALAAGWEYAQTLAYGDGHSDAEEAAREVVESSASLNQVLRESPAVADADVQLGYLANFADRNSPLDTSDTGKFNAIEVRIRKSENQNGQVPFFFARVFGLNGADAEASATAALVRNIRGFKTPSDGSNLQILPFTFEDTAWTSMIEDETGMDDYKWDCENKCVVTDVSDGEFEINLYPNATGSSGNSGTVDIGSSNNSTADIARQILYGISDEDLDAVGGEICLDENGELTLNGDTGISAGVKDELAAIIGQPRVIPIYSHVYGPGNNANYTIVKWVGIRIMAVDLTGSKKKNKKVIVQPAPIVCKGIIESDSEETSDYVYSPVMLVR